MIMLRNLWSCVVANLIYWFVTLSVADESATPVLSTAVQSSTKSSSEAPVSTTTIPLGTDVIIFVISV